MVDTWQVAIESERICEKYFSNIMFGVRMFIVQVQFWTSGTFGTLCTFGPSSIRRSTPQCLSVLGPASKLKSPPEKFCPMLESSRDQAARLLAAEECYSAKECYSANNQFHVNHKPLPNWQYQYQYQSLQRQSGSPSGSQSHQDHNHQNQDQDHQLTLTLVPLLPKAPERNKMF